MCFKWHRERVTNTKDREEQSNGASASDERSSYHSWSRSKCHSVATAHLSSCGGGTTEAGVAFCCTWTLPSTLERSVWVRTHCSETPEKKKNHIKIHARVNETGRVCKRAGPFQQAYTWTNTDAREPLQRTGGATGETPTRTPPRHTCYHLIKSIKSKTG